jgi:release factor glutamine methyltransferase
MTLQQALDEAAARLRDSPHPERGRQDGETLLLHVLGCNRAFLLAHWDNLLNSEQVDALLAWVERRAGGEPIQYITGESEFYGLPFQVTRDVLIPRPETEHLVEKVVELAGRFAAPRIVDVGAGSGAIAVALAAKLPEARVTAIDISDAALALAKRNAAGNGVADRIRFLAGDLLGPISGEQFEIIVSNPPYVAEGDRDSLAVEVREYEPPVALFAGADGMDVYRRLIPQAFRALARGGFIALEIGYGQNAAIRALLAGAGFEDVELTADLQGIPRVAAARRP